MVDHDGGGCVDEVAKDVSRLGILIAVADLFSQEAVEAAGHERELEVTIDFHRHRGAQRVHVEEVHAVSNVVLDEHALGIAGDQLGCGSRKLVGDQQGGLLVSQLGDHQFAKRSHVSGQGDLPIQDAWGAVDSGHPFEFDSPPRRDGLGVNLLQHLAGAAAQRDEEDLLVVKFVEVAIGGELGVENQFLRERSGAGFPELDEPKDLVISGLLTQVGVGVAEHAC